MEITILITIIASSLISAAPNLCDDARLNAAGEPITDSTGRTLSRYCEWSGPDVPLLEANLCCSLDDAAACELANSRGYCTTGARVWCEFGEVDSSSGAVTCYQVFPDACDAGYCVQAPPGAQQGTPPPLLCCGPGGCVPITMADVDDCAGEFLGCLWGMSNDDGTVECFD